MPSVSKAQKRLMDAAAHTPGGYGGVPQSVGKDFAAADKAAGLNKDSGGSPASLPARKGPQRTASAKRKARVWR